MAGMFAGNAAALVTGASSGIGRAVPARRLAAEGAAVGSWRGAGP